jgi:Endonuclease I
MGLGVEHPARLVKSKFMRKIIVLVLVLAQSASMAQSNFEVLFPGQSGSGLLASLVANYKPAFTLPYGQARDTLFSKVLALDDDSLRCIYSGHTLYLSPDADPTQYVFQSGGPEGINTEHAYPQSKGAEEGFARSDMHHLYPTRVPVNEARGSLPYANIPDLQTLKWFIGNSFTTNAPAVNRDGYTELGNSAFEPREIVKGDVARSVFYLYTMYQAQCDAADPNFFELQRATLCQWNVQDPADAAELTKTIRIAPHQDNKPNPYVIDCTLASRTWCEGTAPVCLSPTNTPNEADFACKISPNPLQGNARLELILPEKGQVSVQIREANGQVLQSIQLGHAAAGLHQFELDMSAIPQGNWIVFLEIQVHQTDSSRIKTLPLVRF